MLILNISRWLFVAYVHAVTHTYGCCKLIIVSLVLFQMSESGHMASPTSPLGKLYQFVFILTSLFERGKSISFKYVHELFREASARGLDKCKMFGFSIYPLLFVLHLSKCNKTTIVMPPNAQVQCE